MDKDTGASQLKFTIPMLGLQRNGGNRVIIEIVNRLLNTGHEVEILTIPYYGPPGFAIDERAAIRSLQFIRGPKFIRWVLFTAVSAWLMRGKSIIANHFVTGASSRLSHLLNRNTAIVYYVQDLEFRFFPWPFSSIAFLICKWTYRTKNLLPANTYLERKLLELGASPLKAQGLGIADIFIDTPLSSKQKSVDVLVFLRRGRHKGLAFYKSITKALKAGNRTTLAIVPEEALITPLKTSIDHFIVSPDEEKIIDALDSARVLVFASEHEGFALPPLEAMARGLPVAMFSCGGPSQYAESGKNSLVSPTGDVQSLVANTETILRDEDLYRRLSDGAVLTGRKSRLSDAVKRTCEVIVHLTAKQRESSNS